jgi:hypothetical protein
MVGNEGARPTLAATGAPTTFFDDCPLLPLLMADWVKPSGGDVKKLKVKFPGAVLLVSISPSTGSLGDLTQKARGRPLLPVVIGTDAEYAAR